MKEPNNRNCSSHKTLSNNYRIYTILIFLLVIFTNNLSYVQSIITGTIEIGSDRNVIYQSSAVYTFRLSSQLQFFQNGKLIIIFPSDFSFTQTQTITCADDTVVNLQCQFNYQARLVTITQGIRNLGSFTFTISGITNPPLAIETGFFTIRSYERDTATNSYRFVENSDVTLTVIPQPGTLSAVSLSPQVSVVGSTTTVTLSATLQHPLPVDGKLRLLLPKWNQFATSQSMMQSYMSVSTSPGYVNCNPILNFQSSKLTCLFTQGTSQDILEISMASDATSQIDAGKQIQLELLNFKTPPSLAPITSFILQTTNSGGNLIDQSQSNAITYQANQQATIPSSQISITATDPKINTLTTIQVQIKNLNPIQAGSTLIIKIPTEIGVTELTSVTGSGGRIKNNPTYSLSADKYTITITQFNSQYLESLVNIYVNLATVLTPLYTLPTSSFAITFVDPNGQNIESVSSGVVFRAQPGPLTSYSVTPNNRLINMNNVQYKFSFIPQDTINSGATIKITFPDQISIVNRADSRIISPSSQLSSTQARLTVTQNKYAVITNAFQTTYNPSSQQAISFSLDQITNPPTIAVTDSFTISIYYEENTNVVSVQSTGLTVTAQPNTNINLEVLFQSLDTGFNNMIQFKIHTNGYNIAKGSYMRIVIPRQFEIYDYEIASSTCLRISGFSDEVQCSLTNSGKNGHTLEVRNGFNSQMFQGSNEYVSFNISQIRNPKTTEETSSMTMQIYDGSGNLQYLSNEAQTFTMQGSPFQYAMVSTNNTQVGQSALYTFTLTLGVDTLIDSNIQVYIPDDIVYDTSKPLVCEGVLNLNKTFACLNKNNKVFVLSVRSDKNNVTYIQNGTSVSFLLGYFFNPISLKESNSIQVVTYETSNSNTRYFYINSETQNLRIQNTIRGNISNIQITQNIEELNSPTSLRFRFNTQNKIPQNSKIVITLPLSLQVNNTNQLSAILNNQTASLSYQSSSRQLTVQIPSSINNANYFDLNITRGLLNPWQGPYTYDTYIIEIQTSISYSIDSISISPNIASTQEFKKQNPLYTPININCSQNCMTCMNQLSQCTSCGYDSIKNLSFYYNSDKQQCNTQCDAGLYADSSDFLCKKCEYPCIECSQGPNLCTRCYANHSAPFANPTTLQCYSECPSGTYLDKLQGLCLQCKSPCYTCNNADTCLSCDRVIPSNRFINYYQNRCYDNCPIGTTATPQSSICIECTSPCKTCQDSQPDSCSSCLPGYYHHKNSLCVKTCPSPQYLANDDTMKCDFQGEMVFPLPFSIMTVVFAFGLFVARFMKNQTRFCITLLAFTDIVLKFNWMFLLIYLYVGKYFVSASIIAGCLIGNLFCNLVIWRMAFYRSGLDGDKEYMRYSIRYQCTSKLILFASFILSFHIFRLSYSRLLGKKQFSCQFHNFAQFVRLMTALTLFSLIFVCLPAVVANAYNLAYTNPQQQVFYLDLDGLILVSFECILVGFVIKQGERVAQYQDVVKALIGQKQDVNDMNDEQRKINEAINRMHRQSMARKHFGGIGNYSVDKNDESQESEERVDGDLNEIAQGASRNIFRNLLKQFQTQTSGQTSAKYFSQDNFAGILDLEEYRRLKQLLKALSVQIYNIRQQNETQIAKKSVVNQRLTSLMTENHLLLSEEERLKLELEEMREKLRVFKQVTQKELEDSQNLRREQIKHRMRVSKLKQFIADTVLQKGKQLLQERKLKEQQELEERKRREEELREKQRQELELKKQASDQRKLSFIQPTLSSMMKDNQNNLIEEIGTNRNANVSPLTRRDTSTSVMSPHRAKPPLAQRDRSNNKLSSRNNIFNDNNNGSQTNRGRSTVADRGPKFINEKDMKKLTLINNNQPAISNNDDVDDNRISVANNYTGFRAQSEMRTHRNVSVINSNVIASGLGSPDQRRFTQTQNNFNLINGNNPLSIPLGNTSGIAAWINDQDTNSLDNEENKQYNQMSSPIRIQSLISPGRQQSNLQQDLQNNIIKSPPKNTQKQMDIIEMENDSFSEDLL